jgi:hypothetical protein
VGLGCGKGKLVAGSGHFNWANDDYNISIVGLLAFTGRGGLTFIPRQTKCNPKIEPSLTPFRFKNRMLLHARVGKGDVNIS